jgi:hypothetical protein
MTHDVSVMFTLLIPYLPFTAREAVRNSVQVYLAHFQISFAASIASLAVAG